MLCVNILFLLSEKYSVEGKYYAFISSPVGGHFHCFCILAIVNMWTFIHRYLFEFLFSVPQEIRWKPRNNPAILHAHSLGDWALFSTASGPVFTPANAQELLFHHVPECACDPLFLIFQMTPTIVVIVTNWSFMQCLQILGGIQRVLVSPSLLLWKSCAVFSEPSCPFGSCSWHQENKASFIQGNIGLWCRALLHTVPVWERGAVWKN